MIETFVVVSTIAHMVTMGVVLHLANRVSVLEAFRREQERLEKERIKKKLGIVSHPPKRSAYEPKPLPKRR